MSGEKRTTTRNVYSESAVEDIRSGYEREISDLEYERDRAREAQRNAENRLSRIDEKIERLHNEQKQRINRLNSTQRQFMQKTQQKFQEQERAIRANYGQLLKLQAAQRQEEHNRRLEIAKVRRENNAKIKNLNAKLELANAAQQKALIEQRYELNRQIVSTEQRLSKAINDTRIATERKFLEMNNSFNEKLQNLRRETKQEVANVERRLQNQINELAHRQIEKEKRQAEIAKSWIDSCAIILDSIKQTKHEQFRPGLLKGRLSNDYNRLVNFYNQGIYESTISSAVALFDELSNIYSEIREAEQRFEYELYLFENEIANTISKFRENENINFTIETNFGAESAVLDTNYWTFGEYNKLKGEMRNIIALLDQVDELPFHELSKQRSKLVGLQGKMDELLHKAKERLVASEFRVDLAQAADIALQDLGFSVSVQGGTFFNNDRRQNYHVRFDSSDGNSVVLIIKPNDENLSVADIELAFFDETNDAVAFATYANIIVEKLVEAGLPVGELETTAGYETKGSDRKELLNIEKARRGEQ